MATTTAKPQLSTSEILQKAANRALGGGIAGAMAMGVNVTTLIWLRTTMNYQYRYGTTTTEALKALYKEGGVLRFYKGYLPALVQGPMSRFGDTAANTGTLALMDSYDSTRNLPAAVKTVSASATAAIWRIFLMPVDTLKTTMQVEGSKGVGQLAAKFKAGGPTVLYHGALAASTATFVGHYPWFTTFNILNARIPKYDDLPKKLMRNAFIGFCASLISDTCSNSIRVVKVYRQTHPEKVSYVNAVKGVIAEDGLAGLFGRGLKTKILANGMQGIMFSVMWRMIEDMINKDK
jgi:hypothetical protein|uniref:Uncharacterized protein n=1 Tax=Fibrocapsa japonica TaxID=94617 RepID=A0A7S2V2G3_9STRA|mmetsp:Transcript_2297/g.3404  ORF Transcript_2297/g.3404 Transcript_2297/m.3404 type:complete len:292 (+) Transcript_2297:169-1044(+)|eukprot:CAMPEP_0113934810 /NCGR_PEP_ID=MMETSP1339-20121228/2076_1 /TAXON_ID=94617 /ORGANISM="Fibrocapsa japonica" /LENGTH=291 /DNA_ID=CAMNT_0000936751 /DNA_START=162 /DNA_END=1037 /DNA_ORIENTATION=- /assembly_acc=CAM_ASM_000762